MIDNSAVVRQNDDRLERNDRLLAKDARRVRINERWMSWLPPTRSLLRGPTDELISTMNDLREASASLRDVNERLRATL